MKTALLLCLTISFSAQSLSAQTIEAFGHQWSAPVSADWAVEGEGSAATLLLKVPRPQEKPRRPKQFALLETAPWQTFTLSMEAKSPDGHFIVVYAYKDDSHFNYGHFSVDEAVKQPVHNGIFHVYGGDRVRISSELGSAALPAKDQWVKIQMSFDAKTGIAGATIDGKAIPAFEAVDLSLGPGKIGLGSFFNTAAFRNFKITGAPAK